MLKYVAVSLATIVGMVTGPAIAFLQPDGEQSTAPKGTDGRSSPLTPGDASQGAGPSLEERPSPLGPGPGFGPGMGDPRGLRGPGGFGGPGGFEELKLVEKFDRDHDGQLNMEERALARKSLAESGSRRRGGFAPGGPRGFGGPATQEPGRPGPKILPPQVETCPDAPLYDLGVIRTLFLRFENADWEDELAAFKDTDVEVPALLTVDGKQYPGVGVHFRGMSSFGMIPSGLKRSLNLSLDFVDSKQRLNGYKTLNLLNCNGEPSMMSTVLYSQIAREYMPVPKANFVRVVINGESWGVYANVQQFNKEFVEENYGSSKGNRWKVPGRPNGDSGLAYVGDNIEEYRRRYEIKSNDDERAWKDLINLCRTLDQTAPDALEDALRPILDVDEVLWFLALDVALVNEDGYWSRASDYSLYQDKKGRFHVIPHDMNEAFHGGGGPGGRPGLPGQGRPPFGFRPPDENRPPEGPGEPMPNFRRGGDPRERGPGGPPGFGPPGFGPGPGGMRGGVTLDPLVSLDDPRKPLRSKLLAVPALRKKYLEHVRAIANDQLDWNKLGPTVSKLRELIASDVKADTRKLASYEAFLHATADQPGTAESERHIPLRTFAEKRRVFLLQATSPTTNP